MEKYRHGQYTVEVHRVSQTDPIKSITIRRRKEVIVTLKNCEDFLETDEMILITAKPCKYIQLYEGAVLQFYLVDPALATWPNISPAVPRKILAGSQEIESGPRSTFMK